MNKMIIPLTFLFTTTLTATAVTANDVPVTPESISYAQVQSIQGAETYTYVKCWYRPDTTHDDVATTWEWALDANGDYFTLPGYWYSSVSFKNMFYTDTPQSVIKARCDSTLGVTHDTADMTYFAADTRMSYNHSVWTNDSAEQLDTINKIISFGDSISDTGNLYNGSQWIFPNRNAWFLGHFSNGFVWTEYLAESKDLPLYTWAVGGAAGTTKYVALSGIHDQVDSYLTYMKMAKNYNPQNSLFTIEFGLNDFVNYNRSVTDVSNDFDRALKKLIANGANNIVVLNLPDATKAPQFKYSDPEDAKVIKAKITAFNQFVAQEVMLFRMQGVNITLYDTSTLFENLTKDPAQYGFRNAQDACLNINRSSSFDYLTSHSLTNDCASYGSDSYVFWGVTHPTTQTHKVIAEQVEQSVFKYYNFKK
ncbi:SGNH/GDSL hydrolase family protein [Photobacterium sanguinicancri]|uniref:Thermolabile hemolysin n=1 Tax=Photobacterium sanguinicancri TaxID=875932 RepID=A0ABX4FY24_9GAMM|nr:thermolabile hemolysin [Photobacterium sanguinicancri]